MASSPWGTIQTSRKVQPGIRLVTTAGHGGFMITKRAGDALLSQAARSHSEEWGGYYCFEEDCLAGIVLYEVPGVMAALYGPIYTMGLLEHSLEVWCVDYLFDLVTEWAIAS